MAKAKGEKTNLDKPKFRFFENGDMELTVKPHYDPTTIFVTVLLEKSNDRTIRVELKPTSDPKDSTATKATGKQPAAGGELHSGEKDIDPPIEYRMKVQYYDGEDADEEMFSDITRHTFEEFSENIKSDFRGEWPAYRPSKDSFGIFMERWVDILQRSDCYSDLLSSNRNFTLIIAPIEEYETHSELLSRYDEKNIEACFQRRVLEVDWEKNGRATALDNSVKRNLRCLRNIPKHISGDDLMTEIKKARSLTDADRQTSDPATSKEVSDWYDVTKKVVAWSVNADGDWVLGPKAVKAKCKRMIPSKAILRETKILGEFDDSSHQLLWKGTNPRSAFFVSIDEFELWKIQVCESGVDMSLVKDQIKGISLTELKQRRFSDETSAKEFARMHLPTFYKKLEKGDLKESDYFELKKVEDSARVAMIQDALTAIFVNAQREEAVLIFCDLFIDRVSTEIIERAITMAKFTGSVLNFSIQKSLVNPEKGAKKYTVHQAGESVLVNQRLLSTCVTHSFAIDAEQPNDHIHAAVALATKIANVHYADEAKSEIDSKKDKWHKAKEEPTAREHDVHTTHCCGGAVNKSGQIDNRKDNKHEGTRATESLRADDVQTARCCSGAKSKPGSDPEAERNPDSDRISDAVCILVSGSLENLKQVAEAVSHKMRLLVLEGSGKLCDSLPNIYRARNNLTFNAFQQCDKLIAGCGLIPESVDRLQVNALLTQILQADDASVIIHNVASGVQALQRKWAYVTVLADDKAMINAIERRNVYKAMAKKCSKPSQLISIVCITMSFAITVISTVQGYLNATNALNDQSMNNSTQTPPPGGNSTGLGDVLDASSSNPVLKYLIVVLPVVLSVLSNLRQDWSWGPKVVAFRYCAAVVESELFRYKTRTGPYSDSVVPGSALDAAAGCSEQLSTHLVKVSACLSSMGFVPPDPEELVPKTKTVTARLSEALFSWCCSKPSTDSTESKPVSLADGDEDAQDERVSIEDYLKNRVKKRAADMHREASRLNAALSFYKAYIYIVSASSSILGLLALEVWVPVSTAAITAITQWNETAPLHESLKMVNDAVAILDDIITQWEALPTEKKRLQVHQDRLVEQAEKVMLSAYKPPTGYNSEGIAINKMFTDPTEEADGLVKGPPPGLVTANIQKHIEDLYKKGMAEDQIVSDPIVADVHLTGKEISALIDDIASAQKKKERDIFSMYFKEKMNVNEISKMCQEAESNITAVLFRVRQKVLRIFSDFDLTKVKGSKSLMQAFKEEDEMMALQKDGLTEEGIIFIVENAIEIEAKQSSGSSSAGGTAVTNTVKNPDFPEILMSESKDFDLTDRELKRLRDKIIQCTNTVKPWSVVADLIFKSPPPLEKELNSLVWDMFSKDGMNIEAIISHLSVQPRFQHPDQSKIMEILVENRQQVIKEQMKLHEDPSLTSSLEKDPANWKWEKSSYVVHFLSYSPKPYWLDEQNTYFKKSSNVRECVVYIIRNIFELVYTEMFREDNKDKINLQSHELSDDLKKKLDADMKALFSADTTKQLATQSPHLDILRMKDFAEARKGTFLLTDRDIHRLRDQIRRIITAIQVFPTMGQATRRV